MSESEIKVPSLGESENEATLISWMVEEGDTVAVDDVLAEIESDKITMEVPAADPGTVKKLLKQEGDTVEPGEVIGMVEVGKASRGSVKKRRPETDKGDEETSRIKATADEAEKPSGNARRTKQEPKQTQVEKKPRPERVAEKRDKVEQRVEEGASLSDVRRHAETKPQNSGAGRQEERVAMSGLRRRIAARLKSAQDTAAMLTTFNEVNMQPAMTLRSRYKEAFKEKHGVSLGFMSFFVRACAHAASRFPAVNAYIDGDDIVYHNYMDVGIAVSTDKGLVVPVLRDAGMMSFAEVEKGIADLAGKARDGGLMPDDLKGGTFSITNGGVFGSLLSTPILNPPQSAILGMHAINKRPVVENDQIVIRPMMYVALTYDHRLIDGREAVQFLTAVKEYLEQPGMALLDV